MKILVTGDKGFVGAATVRKLEERLEPGDKNFFANGSAYDNTLGAPRSEYHSTYGFDIMDGLDIRDEETVDAEVSRVDRILHLAAVSRFADADADPLRAYSTNVMGTLNLAHAAEKYHVPMVYASTGSVCMPMAQPPPITEDFPARGNSVYGCTKAAGELIVRQLQTPWIVLRYAHLFGAEKRMHGLVGGFLERVNRGLAPILYGGGQSNDFTYIDDVVDANILALTASWDVWNQVYNIGTGEELTTEQAAKDICEVFEYDGEIERVPQRGVDAQRFFYDMSKTERMLGFKAKHSFREGLELMRAQVDLK